MNTPRGRINRLFGTDGGVMLTLYADFPDDFDPRTTPLLVTIDSLEVPLWCDRFERRGAAGAVAAFADIDTERRAGELLGLEFRLAATAGEEDEEFCLEDLIGFAVEAVEVGGQEEKVEARGVRAETGGNGETSGASGAVPHRWRGTLTDYYDSEQNPLFELEIAGRPVLVPAVEEFIAHIDFERRTIRFVLPEGLLTLE